MTKSINKSTNLEFIRGFAALLVLFGHLFSNLDGFANKKNHITNLFFNWGTECVIIFFILSGIVVHLSFDLKKRTRLQFIKQRAVRLYPTLLIAILISIQVEYLLTKKTISLNTVIGNIVPYSTMQGYLAPLMWNANPAVWSLTFEVFFYSFFAFFIISKNKISYKNTIVGFLCGIASIYFYYNKFEIPVLDHTFKMLTYLGNRVLRL